MDVEDTEMARCDSPSESARSVIGAAIASSTERLVAHLPVAREGVDPEGVHQARVATRRLRSDLRTFAPLLDRGWAEATRHELRRLTEALGAVRDADVLGTRLKAAITETEADGGEVLARLAAERDAARTTLVAAIDDDRTTQLIAELERAAVDPPTTPDADGPARRHLRPLARRPWKRLRRAIDALGDEPSAAELHRVRLLAKKARYAADAVAPAFGKETRRFADSLATLQDVLGDLNDAEQATGWLARTAPELSSEGAFAAGVLAGHFRERARRGRGDWRRHARRAERHSDWCR